MSRYVKTQVTQLSANEQAAIDSINKNFQDIQEAIADTVSRSGNVPTHMTADFDLNGKRIINTSAPATDNDFVRRVDVIGDIATVQSLVNATTNAAAQTLQAAQEVQEIIQDRNVGLVADDLALGDDSKIKQVAGNKDNIDLVASLDDDIEAVAALKDDIPVVVQAAEDIDKVEDIAEDITAVANNAINVTAVAENETNINVVASNSTNINAVASDATNIDTVATNASDVNTVAGSISNVNTVAGNTTDISNVATNMSDVNNCADNMAAIVDAPNQAQAAADSAALAYQYANDKINQTHITNCITDIPQDIKLELNNGTLTLKAGSKLYVPNGAGVFDEVIVDSDKTASISSFSGFVFYRSDNNSFHLEVLQPTSGTTPPSGDGTWYDTSANKIKRYENSSFVYDGISFPLCKCSSGSIDQVFNGFGYIGNTFFAYPNVKGLVPNGRNIDGTLKSENITTQNVYVRQNMSANTTSVLTIGATGFGFVNSYTYNEEENLQYSGTTSFTNGLGYARFTITDGKITSFIPKMPFHAVDYNDKGTVAGWGMPDYTAGVSKSHNTEYTADKNGFLYASVTTNKDFSDPYVTISGTSLQIGTNTASTTVRCQGYFFIRKGSTYKVTGGSTNGIKIYFYPCLGG